MAKEQAKVAENKSDIVREIPMACADESAAVEFMEKQRWGDTPCCPHCGDTDVYQMKDQRTGERNKRHLWRCKGCNKQYTVRIGTVLEDSRIPLRHWCYAFWRACTSKKGVSALEIQRQTGLSYKSALFLMHRIRFAMSEMAGPADRFDGTVEVDETFVGGKPRYVGRGNRESWTRKTPVVAVVQREGKCRVRVCPDVTAKNVRRIIRDHVAHSARVMTDESSIYNDLGYPFEGGHHTVNHRRREYVRGEVTTNTVEGFFSLIKRGIYGVYHNVSKIHLHRYMSEFEFRYNTRKMEDGARTVEAIKGAIGKRLMYRRPPATA